MAPSAIRRRGLVPTWRYWAGMGLLYPLVILGCLLSADARGGLWSVLVGLAASGVALAAMLRERRIRGMGEGRRALWIVLGLVLGLLTAYAALVVVVLVALSDSCLGSPGCFG